MKFYLAYILNILFIFGVQTHFYTNEKYFKYFKELKDRREIESISTSTDFSSTDVFCSDLSAFAQNKKHNIMQNTSESLMAQNNSNVKNLTSYFNFYLCYFNYLPTSKSVNEAFIKASVDYFNIYQEFKYKSYYQFKNEMYGSFV